MSSGYAGAFGSGWPAVDLWAGWEGRELRHAWWHPAKGAVAEQALLPADLEALQVLGAVAVGQSRARLFAGVLPEAGDERVVLCLRGTVRAVQVRGSVALLAGTLKARTRAALLRGAQEHRQAGRSDEAAAWSAAARGVLLAGRRAARGSSVRAVSGGLPTLGRGR